MKRGQEQLERLDDYMRGAGTDAEASAFEEALFDEALAGNARELVAYDWLIATFRRLGDRGTFMNYMSAKEAATMRSRYGSRLYFVEIPLARERQRIVLPRTAELFLTRTPVELRGVERIDIEAHVEGVGIVKTMPDITFYAEEGAIWGCCEGELARQTAGLPVTSKYWATTAEGRRLLGEVLAIVEIG